MFLQPLRFIALVLCVQFWFIQTAHAQTAKKDTIRVLFVGNSYVYYNNLAQMIGLLTDSMNTKIICKKSTAGGASLADHWNGARGLKSRAIILKGGYDIVVIQDNSMRPLRGADSVLSDGKLFCDLIKQTGAKPYIYNTWSRKKMPETQRAINRVYEELGRQNNAVVVPAGNCWAKAIELQPGIELYHSDESHPSAIGTFLVALSFIKKITGALPKGYAEVYNYIDKDGETFRIMQVSKADIALCVKAVNEVIAQ